MNLKKIKIIVDELQHKLSPEDLTRVKGYIAHDEWGIAFEHICVQLYEYEIPITRELYDKIEEYGKSIGISDAYWLPLQELIVKE